MPMVEGWAANDGREYEGIAPSNPITCHKRMSPDRSDKKPEKGSTSTLKFHQEATDNGSSGGLNPPPEVRK
jgi:hypothetical protein